MVFKYLNTVLSITFYLLGVFLTEYGTHSNVTKTQNTILQIGSDISHAVSLFFAAVLFYTTVHEENVEQNLDPLEIQTVVANAATYVHESIRPSIDFVFEQPTAVNTPVAYTRGPDFSGY